MLPVTTTATVTVSPLPTVSLGAAAQPLCQGQTLTLAVGTQPAGSTYRWQDASTGSTFTVSQPGVYSGTVTSPQCCSAQATTTVSAQPAPIVRLGADTVVCRDRPLQLRVGAQPAGATYRWQDGSTSSKFQVQTASTYAVEVTLPGGCTGRDEIVVCDAQCPFKIPNIITPNGDAKNDAFVLEGLNP
ncbi:MAG TPA: hypothetical protein VK364_00470, partial [Hymenobacter sp.]|nr:hypothetical protein [Hymenobacter sp.]